MIFVSTRTATALGFEVVDREDELFASRLLGKALHFLAILNIGVVVLHIAMRGDFVGAIDISCLCKGPINATTIVDVGEVSARVFSEVSSQFCQSSLSKLYLYESVDIRIDFSQGLTHFGALCLVFGIVSWTIGVEGFYNVILKVHIAKEQTMLAARVDGLEVVALLHLRAGVASPVA